MSQIRRILLGAIVLVCLVVGGLTAWYSFGWWTSVHVNPDFELFIAEKFFADYDVWESEDWSMKHKEIPFDIYREDESLVSPNVKWLLPKGGFEKLDSLKMGIINQSDQKFYYISWGGPNSRLRRDLIIYRNGRPDTVWFGGFGCSTGILLEPLNAGAEAVSMKMNPLCRNPYNGYEIPLNTDSLPGIVRTLYGDSVSIRFQLATYSLPWSPFDSQMLSSHCVTVSTEIIIQNWKDGLYATTQDLDDYTLRFYGLAE